MKLRFQLPRPSLSLRNPFSRRTITTHHHPSPFSRGSNVHHAIDVSTLSPSRSARRATGKAQRAARRGSNLPGHRRHHPGS